MLTWFRKPRKEEPPSLRDTLFADVAWSLWGRDDQDAEPWSSFTRGRAALADGDSEGAKALLLGVLSHPGYESRHYLQAWTFLRGMGVQPPPGVAKQVFGVVVEVALPEGVDLLAAYTDRTARYVNFSGKVVAWERADDSCDVIINELLIAAQAVADRIGPWQGARPPVPSPGSIRLNMLTPGGLHFGEGPAAVIGADRMASPVIAAATTLMRQLIGKTTP